MIPLRDDQPRATFPFATILIIAINAAVFFFWQLQIGLDKSVSLAGFVPLELTTHQSGGSTHLITSMFMHAGWMHIIGNMWFLWIFGSNVEDDCGHFRFLSFYLLCGATATLAYTYFSPDSRIPLVGASGAISGVLGAYLLHHPQARILTLMPFGVFTRLMEIPAWVFLLIWIGMQIFYQALAVQAHGQHGGVAYAAHIGGFVAGLGLIYFFEKGPGTRQRISSAR